jgi:hypothetical protein
MHTHTHAHKHTRAHTRTHWDIHEHETRSVIVSSGGEGGEWGEGAGGEWVVAEGQWCFEVWLYRGARV